MDTNLNNDLAACACFLGREFQNYIDACAALGDGDYRKGKKNLAEICQRLKEARKKHPGYADCKEEALDVIGLEYGELIEAAKKESLDRQHDEALDVAATVIRFINYEHVGN